MRVSAEQCLHSTKGFSAPATAPPASRLGLPKAPGGDTAGTSAPNSPKGYPTAYEAVLSNETSKWRLAGAALARGLAGHRSLGGEQLLSFASLVFLGLSFPHSSLCVGFFPSVSLFLLKLSLPEPTRFLPFALPILPRQSPCGGASQRPCGAQPLARVKAQQPLSKSYLPRARELVLPPPSGCGHPP